MTIISAFSAVQAQTQSDPDALPRVRQVDQNDIDLTTLRRAVIREELSVGSGEAALKLVVDRTTLHPSKEPIAGHSFRSYIDIDYFGYDASLSEPSRRVTLGLSSVLLTPTSNSTWVPNIPDGSQLKLLGSSNYEFTDARGNVYLFNATGDVDHATRPYITQITYANGLRINFTYQTSAGWGGMRLSAVTNSMGYMLKFSYLWDGNTSTSNLGRDWRRWSKVVGINLAEQDCSALANSCIPPTGSPSVQYSYPPVSGVQQLIVSDAAGGQTRYTYTASNQGNGGEVIGIKSPDAMSDDWDYDFVFDGSAFFSITNRFGTTKYRREFPDPNNPTFDPTAKVFREDNLGNIDEFKVAVSLVSGFRNYSKILYHRDANGVLTNYEYGAFDRLEEVILPEGNRLRVAYDARGNIINRYRRAKGQTQDELVYAAQFPACTPSTLKTCNQPSWERDALNHQTDFTYSPVHGGVLTETGPALSGGVRPQTRYSYEQRYGRLLSGLAAGPQIWMRSKTELCRTSSGSGSGCAGGAADEVVTSYDYGPLTGPNNLTLRGLALTAEDEAGALVTERTCFSYDRVGNQIVETAPRAGLGSCP